MNLELIRWHLEVAIDLKLNPKEACVIRQIYFDGKKVSEITDSKGIPITPSYVGILRDKALKKLGATPNELNPDMKQWTDALETFSRIRPYLLDYPCRPRADSHLAEAVRHNGYDGALKAKELLEDPQTLHWSRPR